MNWRRDNPLGNSLVAPQQDHCCVDLTVRDGAWHSSVKPEGLFQLFQWLEWSVRQTRLRVKGPLAIIEFGVYTGGSFSRIIKSSQRLGLPIEKFIGIDTWQGMQGACVYDNFYRDGDFCDLDKAEVQRKLFELDAGVSLHSVDLSDRDRSFPLLDAAAQGQICFAHLDVDLYAPTYNALHWAVENLCPGGVIVCDDYGWADCAGARQACDKVAHETGNCLIKLPTSQAVLIKGM
jgi:hypothetical protein